MTPHSTQIDVLKRQSLSLVGGEVHVWCARLDRFGMDNDLLMDDLSDDERARADSFHLQGDHDRFVRCRWVLRDILANYLRVPRPEMRFRNGVHGKPALVPEHGLDDLSFNVSRSGNIALYALASSARIGIDVEYARPELADRRTAEQFFARSEVAALFVLPKTQFVRGFFNCWTRKEATLKALGDGLTGLPLDRFEVNLTPGEPARILSIRGDSREGSKWSLLHLTPEIGTIAALCVEGTAPILKCCRWSAPVSAHSTSPFDESRLILRQDQNARRCARSW